MKLCKWCHKRLKISEFFSHPMMKERRLNKCISCCKAYAHRRYGDKIEMIRKYDRERALCPERKKKCLDYQRIRRKRYPEKDKARRIFHYNKRMGRIVRLPCRDCGDKQSEAHHPDYSKPLEVIWLCSFHHRKEEGRLHGQMKGDK